MVEGWISLHRKIQECEIWANSQPFDMRSAWVDLLLLANHRDVDMIFDYTPLTVKRGQYLTSVRKLGARWSWSNKRTLKYLRLLESLNMITRESNAKRTLITIVKYEVYQDTRNAEVNTNEHTEVNTEETQGKRRGITNNNDNNDNNDNKKNKYPSSFNEFWETYPKKQDKGQAYKCYQARLNDGWTEDEMLTACQNYAAECQREKRETRYIKNGSTFLSSSTPFTDYLKGGTNEQSERRINGDTKTDAEREAEYRAIIEYSESEEAKREDADAWGDMS